MGDLRKPFFFVAVALIVLAVLIEFAGGLIVRTGAGDAALDVPNPGLGIPYLALLDSLILYAMGLMLASVFLPDNVLGKLQGIASLIVSLLIIIGGFFMAIAAFALLILMVSLLLAVPFGTAVYFATYDSFPRGEAAVTLSLIITLKIAFAVFLVLAHQRFLQNKGLVFLVLVSLLLTVLIKFLHSFPPPFLASITDAIGALIIAILAVVFAIIALIGAIGAITKAIA